MISFLSPRSIVGADCSAQRSLLNVCISVGMVMLTCLVFTRHASATNITPTILTDATYTSVSAAGVMTGGSNPGQISLRSALEAMDLTAGPHTLTLNGGTYQVTRGTIYFGSINNQTITINGVASAPLTSIINMSGVGVNLDRIFGVNVLTLGGTDGLKLTLNSVKLTGGHLNSDPYGGGAIEYATTGNTSSLTITNCEFANNTIDVAAGTTGGAVNYSGSGTLTVTNTLFNNNSNGNSDGGALYYFFNNLASNNTGLMNVSGCTFSGNSVASGNSGGALGIALQGRNSVNQNFTANVTKNTFTTNSAPGVNGGGAIIANNGDPNYFININFNRFFNNSANGSTTYATSGLGRNPASGSVNAVDNWWGCDQGPTAGGVQPSR